MTLKDLERRIILKTLKRYKGNRTNTARALGISIRTLRNKLIRYWEQGYSVKLKTRGLSRHEDADLS